MIYRVSQLRKRVLIYVDQKRRDTYPSKRIQKALSNYDLDVKIAGKSTFIPMVSSWHPHIIIFGKHDGFHGDWLRNIIGAYVFSLGTEQGSSNVNYIDRVFFQGHAYPRLPAHEKVDCFLVYNELTKSRIKSKLPNSNVNVIGSPRLYNKYLQYKPRLVENKKLTIGIICGEDKSNFNSAYNYFKKYFNHEQILPKSFDDFNNLQGLLSFWFLEKIIFNFIIEKIQEEYPSSRIIARVRYDNQSSYINTHKDLEFDISDDPSYLISESDIVITSQSTLGYECMMAGVPAISIVKLINPGVIYEKLSTRNYTKPLHHAETLDDIYALLNKRLENKLDISSDKDDYIRVAKDFFFNNLDEDKSIDEIVKLVNNAPIKSRYGARINTKKLFKMLSEECLISIPHKFWIIGCKIHPIFFFLGNSILKFIHKKNNPSFYQ